MKSLAEFHLKNNAVMGVYNNRTLPSSYHDAMTEYKAVRENALLVDYSHLSIVSVMGDDAWALINQLVSADVSIIRDEQAIYSLVLNEEGTIRGDVYVLCSIDGYYLLSEDISATELIASMNTILEKAEELDIQSLPEIQDMRENNWGAILLEGPYSWEIMSEIHGFDVIGLPYYEYMNTDEDLLIFRCGKHGEYAYMTIGEQAKLAEQWEKLLTVGEKYLMQTGGLDYQKIVRLENPCWDASLWEGQSVNPVQLQMQWAVQYDKDDFIGKDAVTELSQEYTGNKLIGMIAQEECEGIEAGDRVLVEGQDVGYVVKAVFSPALQRFIALTLLEKDYAWSDISGYEIQTAHGIIPAQSKCMPFIYNLSMLVSPTEHSYINASKNKSAA
ncbi:TPA: aminomethyltransferase family protein [Escherichia coli]